MKKNRIILTLTFGLAAVFMTSCSNAAPNTVTVTQTVPVTNTVTVTQTVPVTNTVTQTVTVTKEPEVDYTYTDEMTYETKELNIYRQKGVVDKKFPVRFYSETPNIPYVDITKYYKEFFGRDYTLTKDNYMYTFTYGSDNYMKYDIKNDVFYANGIDVFSSTDFFISATGKTFLKIASSSTTPMTEKIVDLKKYSIDIHGDDNLYVPLTFLSTLSGGGELYNVAYNTKDIYVLDIGNMLNNKTTDPNTGLEVAQPHNLTYFGTDYTDPIEDKTEKRPQDLIDYNYGQLCFDFDVLRGYTSQLIFGDNALISLGLDGLLESYYPRIKEALLSDDKETYYFGFKMLFAGLYDGGHTSLGYVPQTPNITIDDYGGVYKELALKQVAAQNIKTIGPLAKQKKQALGFEPNASTGFYYKYDDTTKTALIGFDTFAVDYNAWNNFYKENKTPDQAPINTDTYAFIRSALYQAKADGAENVAFDLTSNGGGDTGAVCGIVGLLNGGKAALSMNLTLNKYRGTDECLVDINLDGKYDEDDITEANKLKFNYAVITTPVAFSCGNLLPSLLKELGVKIVGQRSGGGSCTISVSSTPDGLLFVRSNDHNLSNAAGENIDSGVPLDYEISITDAGGNIDLTPLYTFDFKAYFDSLGQQA